MTHQPSPWVRDYAHFMLMPQSGWLPKWLSPGDWLRRIIGDNEAGHRVLCIDKMNFDGNEMLPVIMT